MQAQNCIYFLGHKLLSLSALAAGTIIYVTVFEIMQRERSKAIKPKIVQFLAMVAGFATMMTVDLTRELKILHKLNSSYLRTHRVSQ